MAFFEEEADPLRLKNVHRTLEEAGKKIEKTGDALKDTVENGASSLDDASITMVIENENRQLQP